MLAAASVAEARAKLRQKVRLRRLFAETPFDLPPLRGTEHAQYVFSGKELVGVGRIYGVVLIHRSRQVLSFNSPRLIQLFIVPSGTRMR